MGDVRYAPFYCEENAWFLCQRDELAARDPHVVIVSNAVSACAMWEQRSAPPRQPVFWDYHVFVVVTAEEGWEVWDLDSRLPQPCATGVYLERSFRTVGQQPPELDPAFRVLDAATYAATLASDRHHMREGESWRAPPPGWPPIGDDRPHNLDQLIDLEDPFVGTLLDLPGLRARFPA